MPYNPSSSITKQVQESITSSLHNLRISDDPREQEATYIDGLVLHSPYPSLEDTLEAWHAAEAFIPDTIKFLGISNVSSTKVLQELYRQANVKPSVVQNRFHRDTDYEKDIRKYCLENDMVFQSFWTLTANPQLLKSKPVLNLASTADVDPAVAMYALVMGLENVVVLNGTTSHIEDDIEGLARVKAWAEEKTYDWENSMKHFKDLIGENLMVQPPIRGVEQT